MCVCVFLHACMFPCIRVCVVCVQLGERFGAKACQIECFMLSLSLCSKHQLTLSPSLPPSVCLSPSLPLSLSLPPSLFLSLFSLPLSVPPSLFLFITVFSFSFSFFLQILRTVRLPCTHLRRGGARHSLVLLLIFTHHHINRHPKF